MNHRKEAVKETPTASQEKLNSDREGLFDVTIAQIQQVDADESDQQGGDVGGNASDINSGEQYSHGKSS